MLQRGILNEISHLFHWLGVCLYTSWVNAKSASGYVSPVSEPNVLYILNAGSKLKYIKLLSCISKKSKFG